VIWMAKLDPNGTVQIPSPTPQEMVVSTASIPGLELHLPAGTVIRDHEGNLVTEVNITAIPVNQPPFPLPDFHVPVYFTIQPGGATISGSTPSFAGAQLWYPNYLGEPVGARAEFWNYDPLEKGWYTYGLGSVSADRRQVIPNPGVAIYEFSGAMINGPPPPAPSGPCTGSCCGAGSGGTSGSNGSGGNSGSGSGGDPNQPGEGGGGSGSGGSNPPEKCANSNPDQGQPTCSLGGDPVDLAGGQWTFTETDLEIADVFPIRLSRTYKSFDQNARMFGPGMSLSYDVMQYSPNEYQVTQVIPPIGAPIY